METYEHNLDFIYYDKEIQLDILHELIDLPDDIILDTLRIFILKNIIYFVVDTNIYDSQFYINFTKSETYDNMYKMRSLYKYHEMYTNYITIKEYAVKNTYVDLGVYNRDKKLKEIGII